VIVDDIADETDWVEKARAIWGDYYHTIGPDGEAVANRALAILDDYANQ